jgi:flavin reductase (DIM6/NTAB) family NADH-FMN oxidoreductase RutF
MTQSGAKIRGLESREPLSARFDIWRDRGLVDETTFRTVLGHSPTAISVVTVRDLDGCHHGITVGSYTSLSLDPPLVLACIDQRTRVHSVLGSATSFSISVLSADQECVARRFSSHCEDRFAGVASFPGIAGNMLIEGALAYLECELVDRYRGGDHTIFIGAVKSAQARAGRPLFHFRGAYVELADQRESPADTFGDHGDV